MVTADVMIAEENSIFTHVPAKSVGPDAYFGFRFEVKGDAIKRLWIYAGSQKLTTSFKTS